MIDEQEVLDALADCFPDDATWKGNARLCRFRKRLMRAVQAREPGWRCIVCNRTYAAHLTADETTGMDRAVLYRITCPVCGLTSLKRQ